MSGGRADGVVQAAAGGARISVFAKPRASKTRIVGLRADALIVAVSAPPVDGAANQAITEFLARRLSVPKRAVTVASGQSGRNKIVAVQGLGPEEIVRALGFEDLPGFDELG